VSEDAQTPGTVPAAVPGALDLVKRTLAAAYRQAATWIDNPGDMQALNSLAYYIEKFDGTDACCPVCQEVVCDTGCPLEPIRVQP